MGLPMHDATAAAGSSTESLPTTQPQQTGQATPGATGAGANTGAGVTREKTAEEIEADRLYEERMEDEYAKRDGGA